MIRLSLISDFLILILTSHLKDKRLVSGLWKQHICYVTVSILIVTSLRHVSHPSVFDFSYIPNDVCHTTLFTDPVCTLSILESDSRRVSLHLLLGCDEFLLLDVADRPGLTVVCHYWEYTFLNAFLFSLIGTFLSRMMLPSLQNVLQPCSSLLFISCSFSRSSVTFPR